MKIIGCITIFFWWLTVPGHLLDSNASVHFSSSSTMPNNNHHSIISGFTSLLSSVILKFSILAGSKTAGLCAGCHKNQCVFIYFHTTCDELCALNRYTYIYLFPFCLSSVCPSAYCIYYAKMACKSLRVTINVFSLCCLTLAQLPHLPWGLLIDLRISKRDCDSTP